MNGSVHKNTGFWKMHRSAYRVQLPVCQYDIGHSLQYTQYTKLGPSTYWTVTLDTIHNTLYQLGVTDQDLY